jgi:VIT1/CCC1 family predicted Fe2+/Mn2+ transporter
MILIISYILSVLLAGFTQYNKSKLRKQEKTAETIAILLIALLHTFIFYVVINYLLNIIP